DSRPAKLRSQRDINLWRIPLKLSIGAIALFCVTLIPDILDAHGVIHIPSWLTMGSIDDARAILSAMMGAVATVLALIFSVGLFMGTFIYVSLCFLVTHQDANSRFIPQITLLTSWLLVVCSFAFLVYYSHRIATSIQNPDMIARVVDDLYPAVVGMHERAPGEGTGSLPDDGAILRRADAGGIGPGPKSGHMQPLR